MVFQSGTINYDRLRINTPFHRVLRVQHDHKQPDARLTAADLAGANLGEFKNACGRLSSGTRGMIPKSA